MIRSARVIVAAAMAVSLLAGEDRVSAIRRPIVESVGNDQISVPGMLSYQGKLTDTFGLPVPDTTYGVSFMLYTQPTGGSSFWNEDQTVRTRGGLFSVLLGAANVIDSVPSAGALYLALKVGTFPEMTPRIRIASAAYSFLAERAASSDQLQGKDTLALSAKFVDEGQSAGGDLAGTYPGPSISQKGAAVGQVLKWTGDSWQPRNDSIGGGGGGGTVTSVSQATGVVCNPNPIVTTGSVRLDTSYANGHYVNEGQVAGGDLTGPYPSPSIAQKGATDGQVLKWATGVGWTPRNDSVGGGGGGGTVRKVVQATGIVCSPNPITDSGTVRFDSTWGDGRFINEGQTAGSDLVGAYPNPTVDGLQGRAVSAAAPNSGQVLKWRGSAWTPADDSVGSGGVGSVTATLPLASSGGNNPNISLNVGTGLDSSGGNLNVTYGSAAGTACQGNDSRLSDSRPPTGPAGGDLTGTYPNPQLGPSGVTASTYGSSSQSAVVTVDPKGRITAASNVSIVASNADMVDGYHAGNSSGQVAVSNGTTCTNLSAHMLEGRDHSWFAPNMGGTGYIWNQSSSDQDAKMRIMGSSGGSVVNAKGDAAGSGVVYALNTGAGYGVAGYTSSSATTRAGGHFQCSGAYADVGAVVGGTNYRVYGSGACTGVFDTKDGPRTTYCPEAPEPLMEDLGAGQLIKGHAHVDLDPLFLDCVKSDEEHPFRVFVQLNSDCRGVYVETGATCFDVHELQGGTGNAKFSYRVVGHRADAPFARFAAAPSREGAAEPSSEGESDAK